MIPQQSLTKKHSLGSTRRFHFIFLWFRDPKHFILASIFVVFLEALSLSKNSWKCASVVKFKGLTHLKSIIFFSFLIIFEARAVIFEARTVFFEARGAIWTIFEIFVIFSKKRHSYNTPRGPQKCTCCGLVRYLFLWMFLLLDFCDFECPDTPFWLQFWLLLGSTGPLEKQLKVCECCQFQRFDPFEIKTFPRSCSWLCFLTSFLRKIKIFSDFGDSIFNTFETNCHVKKTCKKQERGEPRPIRGNGVWTL